VMAWTPPGTSVKEAARVMERHGFRCSPLHNLQGAMPGDLPAVECRRTNHVINRVWVVRLYFKNDRVAGAHEQIFSDPFRMFRKDD
jgi:hypothetical protein